MDEYIKWQTVMDCLVGRFEHPVSLQEYITATFDKLQKAPPEDVVEIVRCKDCKWRDHINCAIEEDEYGYRLNENDFCSFGERKDDEQNGMDPMQ